MQEFENPVLVKANPVHTKDIFLACPVITLVPEILYADYGKKVQFQVSVEAKLEYPTNGRWQKISNGVVLKSIDTNTAKYRNTSTLPPIQLVINNADFDDVGEYRLQVRISNGWCSSSTLQLQHIYGGMLFFYQRKIIHGIQWLLTTIYTDADRPLI